MAENDWQMSVRDFPERFDVKDPRGDGTVTYVRIGDQLCAAKLVVGWDPPHDIDSLGVVDLGAYARQLADYYMANVVIDKVEAARGKAGMFEFLDSPEHVRANAAAHAVTRQAIRPRKRGALIDDAFLKEVVDRVKEHGTKATWEHYDVNERTLRRWLSLADERKFYEKRQVTRKRSR